jgi:hypothetical protein
MSWKRPESSRGQASGGQGPPIKVPKFGDVMAIAEAPQQQGKKGEKQAHQPALTIALQLIDQLEARLREVEGILFDTVRIAGEDARVMAGREALKVYAKMVTDNTADHGPPHAHIFAAVLGTITSEKVEETSIATRAFSLRMLRALLLQQELPEVTAWVRSFRISDLFQKQGDHLMARMQWNLRGSIRVPPTSDLPRLMAEANAAEAAGQEALQQMAMKVVGELVEGIPTPAEGNEARGKVVQVQALLTSYLCATGGSRFMGKAPRGGLSYKLHQNIKGKGKGKNGKGDEDMDL